MSSLHLLNPYGNTSSSSPPCILIQGGPWGFSKVRAASSKSAAVACSGDAALGCETCVFEGLDSDTLRASVAFEVFGSASVRLAKSVLQDSIGPSLLARERGKVEASDCTFQYGLFGASVGDEAEVRLGGCFIRRQRNAVFTSAPWETGNVASILRVQGCFGGENRDLWGSSRRPSVVEMGDDCVWGGWEERGAEFTALEGPAMNWMLSMRHLEGQSEPVMKAVGADEWAKGGEIRKRVREYNAVTLNRHEAWLKRRRWQRRFYYDMSGGIENATMREFDSDDALYDNEFGMQTRPAPGLDPTVMSLM